MWPYKHKRGYHVLYKWNVVVQPSQSILVVNGITMPPRASETWKVVFSAYLPPACQPPGGSHAVHQ